MMRQTLSQPVRILLAYSLTPPPAMTMRLCGTRQPMLGQLVQTLCGCKRGGTWGECGPGRYRALSCARLTLHTHIQLEGTWLVRKVLSCDFSVCEWSTCMSSVHLDQREGSVQRDILFHTTSQDADLITFNSKEAVFSATVYRYNRHVLKCIKVYQESAQ